MNLRIKQILGVGILTLSALMLNAQDALEKINQANKAFSSEDYVKAFGLYDDAIKNPGIAKIDPAVYYYVGYSAYRCEKFNEAIVYFDKAIKAGSNVSKAWENKANSYNKLNDYANAVTSFEKAAASTKVGGEAFIYNAAIAANKGEMFDKAVELFTKSVEKGYKGETAQYYKAVVLKNQKKDAEYKQALVEGVAKFPGNKKLGEALAKVYVNEGNELFQKGVAIFNVTKQKVKDGALKTADADYKAELEKAKVEFKSASDILQKAVSLDAANENATKLLDQCKQGLAI